MPITTPFGFSSTALEVVSGVDLHGKHAIVTGGASGIGIETARALATAGARVTLAVRDVAAADPVAAQLRAATGNAAVSTAGLDLLDRRSIVQFVDGWDTQLDILINNAGVMALPDLRLTDDGIEMQFATNHLGHFALALGLRGALRLAGSARVVSVSSSAHMRSPVIFDDISFAFCEYSPWAAYAQSKTANILFAVEAARRWAEDGITVNALMPGAIPTRLQRYTDGLKTPEHLRKTPEQGAATSVLLAASPLLDGVTGRYFVDCAEAEVVLSRSSDLRGVAPYAVDDANAQRLWYTSLQLLGQDGS